jgi:hypothetical protein
MENRMTTATKPFTRGFDLVFSSAARGEDNGLTKALDHFEEGLVRNVPAGDLEGRYSKFAEELRAWNIKRRRQESQT